MPLLFTGPEIRSGTLRRQFVRTQPVYLWGKNQSVLSTDYPGNGAFSPVLELAASGVRDHYDTGNETALLSLLPVMAGEASISSRLTSPALNLLPVLAASAVIARDAVGTFTLATVLDGQAHTETGGNKSASGSLNSPRVLTGSGTLQHPIPGTIQLSLIPALSGSSLLFKTGTGNLALSPVLTGNAIVTRRGRLELQPTLSGQGQVGAQSGIWIIIPEDTRGWTVQ